MPELSKLEWIIPRTFPNENFEDDIYCIGDHKYVLKCKNDSKYMMITGYGEWEKEEFIPELHPEIDLSKIETYRIQEQISLVNGLIEKSLDYLESLPDFSLLVLNDIITDVFGSYQFIEPSTVRFDGFDLEESMYSIYFHDLIEKANESGIYFPDLHEYYLKNLKGYDKAKRQDLLRKNCLPEKKETEDFVELTKETFSGHRVIATYSKKENKYAKIVFEENPVPKRKHIPGFIGNPHQISHGDYDKYYEGELFIAAAKNDLDGLKRVIAEGADINSRDGKYHESVLAVWLSGYYSRKDADIEEALYMYATTNGSFEYNNFPPDHLCVPLDHRNDGLLEAVDWMMDNGLNLNDGYSETHEIEDTPLHIAVYNMDYYMTKYLLDRGADPYEWIWSDPDEREEDEKEDAIGHLIACGLSDSSGPVTCAIWLKFARLLMEHGYEGEFFSYPNSLYIEPEKDRVFFTQTAFPKY